MTDFIRVKVDMHCALSDCHAAIRDETLAVELGDEGLFFPRQALASGWHLDSYGRPYCPEHVKVMRIGPHLSDP